MQDGFEFEIDPELDLILERSTHVTPEILWKAWTEPEHLKAWFCPRPWKTTECSIDLRPGGAFSTVMEGPNGEKISGPPGCYLEIVKNRKLVWTNALLPGYRPMPLRTKDEDSVTDCGELLFTAVILIEPNAEGSTYIARAIHQSSEGRELHEEMGFHEGWAAAFDQLVEYSKQILLE